MTDWPTITVVNHALNPGYFYPRKDHRGQWFVESGLDDGTYYLIPKDKVLGRRRELSLLGPPGNDGDCEGCGGRQDVRGCGWVLIVEDTDD